MEELQLTPVQSQILFAVGCITILIGYTFGSVLGFNVFGIDLNPIRIAGWVFLMVAISNMIFYKVQEKRENWKEQYK